MITLFIGRRLNLLLIAMLSFAVAACAPMADDGPYYPQSGRSIEADLKIANSLGLPGDSHPADISTNQRSCAALNGDYRRDGLAGYYGCYIAFPDGGKSCTSSSECYGICKADESGNGRPQIPGKCSPSSNAFGCYGRVENGRIAGTICVD